MYDKMMSLLKADTVGEVLGSPVQIKLISDAEEAQFSELLNRTFGLQPGENFLSDFPVWGLKSGVRKLGAFSGGVLVASACARVARLRLSSGQVLRIGLIGAVATSEEFRGQGLASGLVRDLLKWLNEEKVGLSLLWGSEHDLYRRLGFELGGSQVRVPLSALQLTLTEPVAIQEGWNGKVFEQLMGRGSGLQLERQDLDWFSRHKNVKWYSSQRAYLGYGRGIDLKGMIHEWGGDWNELRALFQRVLFENEKAEWLLSVEHARQFRIPETAAVQEYLCLIHLNDPKLVLGAFRPDLDFRLELYEGRWNFQCRGYRADGLSAQDLVMLFFGHESFCEEWKDIFPLPLWIWGLDAA